MWDDEIRQRNRVDKDIHAARKHRDLKDATYYKDDVKNVDQAINYKRFHAGALEDNAHSGSKIDEVLRIADKSKKRLNEGLHEVGSRYNRNLKFNKDKRDIKNFIKDNKKSLVIGGTIGTALVGGGIALHRYNKKKKKEEEKIRKDQL